MDIRRFLAELKGRGVYRVAAVYAASSWALLQVADVLFPVIGLPDWAIAWFLTAAAIGFPIAVGLAWLFDLSPEGIRETDAEIADSDPALLSPARVVEVALLVTLVLLVGFLYLDRLGPGGSKQNPEIAMPALERPAIAVMAFENLSEDPGAGYFGNGVAEAILNLLSQLPELDVAARTSSFYYAGRTVDVREIGKTLGVGHVLEGSVRRSDERVRVNAQLVDVRTGYRIWSETFDRDYSDSFLIQDEIARQVTDQLQLLLSERSQRILNDRPRLNPQAYDFYLRARDYLRAPGSQSLDSAITLFQRALELDGDYASAYAGLCEAYLKRYRLEKDPDYFAWAESTCQRALQLSPNAPPVHVALGNLYQESGRVDDSLEQYEAALAVDPKSADALIGRGWAAFIDDKPELAEESFAQAIQVQPTYARAYTSMGDFLFESGRFEEAIPYFRRIAELVPDSAQAFSRLAVAYYALDDFKEASRAWERSLAIEPTALAYANSGSSMYYLGRYRKAVEMYHKAVELAPEDFETWGALGDAYRALEGAEQELAAPMYENAVRLAEERLLINPQDAINLSLVAYYQARLGRREDALQSIAKAQILAPQDIYVQYNLALAFTHLQKPDEALSALRSAVDLGYPRQLLALDAGLRELEGLTEFQQLAAYERSGDEAGRE